MYTSIQTLSCGSAWARSSYGAWGKHRNAVFPDDIKKNRRRKTKKYSEILLHCFKLTWIQGKNGVAWSNGGTDLKEDSQETLDTHTHTHTNTRYDSSSSLFSFLSLCSLKPFLSSSFVSSSCFCLKTQSLRTLSSKTADSSPIAQSPAGAPLTRTTLAITGLLNASALYVAPDWQVENAEEEGMEAESCYANTHTHTHTQTHTHTRPRHMLHYHALSCHTLCDAPQFDWLLLLAPVTSTF